MNEYIIITIAIIIIIIGVVSIIRLESKSDKLTTNNSKELHTYIKSYVLVKICEIKTVEECNKLYDEIEKFCIGKGYKQVDIKNIFKILNAIEGIRYYIGNKK